MKKKNYQIAITRKQFLDLMKVVYLGNWMANAYRTNDKLMDYEKIENWVFSHAKLFGFDEYVDHEIDDEHYYPTGYFESEMRVHEVHEAYDEETFWEELIERLATREFAKTIKPEVYKRLSRDERFEKFCEIEERISKLIYKKGLDALSLAEN